MDAIEEGMRRGPAALGVPGTGRVGIAVALGVALSMVLVWPGRVGAQGHGLAAIPGFTLPGSSAPIAADPLVPQHRFTHGKPSQGFRAGPAFPRFPHDGFRHPGFFHPDRPVFHRGWVFLPGRWGCEWIWVGGRWNCRPVWMEGGWIWWGHP